MAIVKAGENRKYGSMSPGPNIAVSLCYSKVCGKATLQKIHSIGNRSCKMWNGLRVALLFKENVYLFSLRE